NLDRPDVPRRSEAVRCGWASVTIEPTLPNRSRLQIHIHRRGAENAEEIPDFLVLRALSASAVRIRFRGNLDFPAHINTICRALPHCGAFAERPGVLPGR